MRNNSDKIYKEPTFSVQVNKTWLPDDYVTHVDEKILNVNFEPDIFQRQAFYFLSRNESIFVSAHTSSGKTLVAEYAIALAQKTGSRTIYTSPIKALSNQKFYDFKQKFDDVGIITGDVQVNPTARCLIMTTEILRNLVYKNNDILSKTKFIVFDEVHYINDQDRGVVWEECIIMLPKHISLILLSATIPNSKEFSDWVGRTKNRCIYIISTDKRPVPLEHLIYSDREVYYISEPPKKTDSKVLTSNIRTNILPYSKKQTPVGKFKIIDLANFIVRKRLTPTILFCFSKKKCESLATYLTSLTLTSPIERKQISDFLFKAIQQLPVEDRNLPQIMRMKELAGMGIAVHHGALLPFVKECVEILFSLNLIKMLIATETFAMGVNMPAKSVAFLSLTKVDGDTFRYLSTGEYTQMSGRAGRRGMDKVGTVLIADEKTPSLAVIRKIIEGTPLSLSSQFKLSFSLILIALRSNIKVEELMKKSYKEHVNQKHENRDMFRIKDFESKNKILCEDIDLYIDLLTEIVLINTSIICKYKVIEEGQVVMLMNNEVGKVRKIEKDKIFIEEIPNLSSESTFSSGNSKLLLMYPHTVLFKSRSREVSFSDIFCILKEGKPVFDYSIKNVEDYLKMKKLEGLYHRLTNCCCLACPSFKEHYLDAVKYKETLEEISKIKLKYSIENLGMIEEYNSRMRFLVKNEFYNDFVTLKGRVAAEIRTVNEVLATEMIFDNEFKHFSPAVVISLFSSMINEEENEEYPYNDELKDGVKRLNFHFAKLNKDMEDFFISPFRPLNLTLIQAVYDWCHKETLQSLVNRYNISEGSFVRLILRLDECCREMINSSIIIEDVELEKKFTDASNLLKREIVFLPSLYL